MFRSISLSADHTVRRNSGATPFNRDFANWVLRIGQCPVTFDPATSGDPWVATTTAPPATGLPQALYSSDMCEFTPTTDDAAAGSTTPVAATPMPTGANDDDDDNDAVRPSLRGGPANPNGDYTLAVAPIGSTPPWSSIYPQVHKWPLNTVAPARALGLGPLPSLP